MTGAELAAVLSEHGGSATLLLLMVHIILSRRPNETVRRELEPNGGDSVRDRVCRLEAGQEVIRERIDRMGDRLDEIAPRRVRR